MLCPSVSIFSVTQAKPVSLGLLPRFYLAGHHEILARFAEDVAALGAVPQAGVAEHGIAEGALLVAIVANDLL